MRVTIGLRGDYAVRAMLALTSLEADGRPVSVPWIATRMAIPVRFLPQVMADLGRAGLVVGTPGRAGGYRLARAAAEVSVLDVVEAVEPDDDVRRCVLRGGPCGPDGRCAVHDLFTAATEALRTALASQTLRELSDAGGLGAIIAR
jgi:Rrf2 family iron-sulfur cluster assembly transcriptional regulator